MSHSRSHKVQWQRAQAIPLNIHTDGGFRDILNSDIIGIKAICRVVGHTVGLTYSLNETAVIPQCSDTLWRQCILHNPAKTKYRLRSGVSTRQQAKLTATTALNTSFRKHTVENVKMHLPNSLTTCSDNS